MKTLLSLVESETIEIREEKVRRYYCISKILLVFYFITFIYIYIFLPFASQICSKYALRGTVAKKTKVQSFFLKMGYSSYKYYENEFFICFFVAQAFLLTHLESFHA